MGQTRVSHWFECMVIEEVKPLIAGDIWLHGGCSLMGICMYGIGPSWTIKEWLVDATPFGATRHTGDAIDALNVASLQRHGMKWHKGGSVYEVRAASTRTWTPPFTTPSTPPFIPLHTFLHTFLHKALYTTSGRARQGVRQCIKHGKGVGWLQ